MLSSQLAVKSSVTFPHQREALRILFFTEMWERYGFYIIQGLLVLYLTSYWKLSDSDSYLMLGVFTALVYLAPILGGYFADTLLGFKASVIWGGLFLIIAYVLLSVTQAFYLALATIILGTGLLKPSITSLLGLQYAIDDPKREAAFTIFYIGINVGIVLAGVSSGYIKAWWGWQASFGTASVWLIISLATFVRGQSVLNSCLLPQCSLSKQKRHGLFLLGCWVMIACLTFLLKFAVLINWLLLAVAIAIGCWLRDLIKRQPDHYKKSLTILVILIASSILYWMLYMQMFFSVNLFIDRLVDKHLLGVPMTTPVFYAFESIFIILLGPLFARLWHQLNLTDNNPSPMMKFILGIGIASIGFFILAISTGFPAADGLINPLWVIAAYLCITLGELFIAPTGSFAVTSLAPPNIVGLMIGVWLGSIGVGSLFAGWIAKLASLPLMPSSQSMKLLIYRHAFFDYAYFALCSSILLWIIRARLYSKDDERGR